MTQALTEELNNEFGKQLRHELPRLVTVATYDPTGSDRNSMLSELRGCLRVGANCSAALNAIESVCGEMIGSRGSFDQSSLRHELRIRGVDLAERPSFEGGITTLRHHTKTVSNSLKRFGRIEIGQETISIDRDCQNLVNEAALEHSLLLVGQQGVGKSGILSAIAQYLLAQGKDVLLLAVVDHSAECLKVFPMS